jgi:hypothetical protein
MLIISKIKFIAEESFFFSLLVEGPLCDGILHLGIHVSLVSLLSELVLEIGGTKHG